MLRCRSTTVTNTRAHFVVVVVVLSVVARVPLAVSGMSDSVNVFLRRYRDVFYSSDLSESISGVIMYKEALSQASNQGKPFLQCLSDNNILAGVKMDEVRD